MIEEIKNSRKHKWCSRCTLFVAPFFIFHFSFCILAPAAQAQDVADKMVASVNSNGVQPSLITYSDLLWQLALQPGTPVENPTSENLNRALNLIISQRLILQEAEKLPTITPTNQEIKAEKDELARQFPSQTDLMQRAARVGLSGDQLNEILRQRVAINKYLDFRFRSFVVVTQKEVEDYYRDVWLPRFRRQQPGSLVPGLEDVYKGQKVSKIVETELTESKIESDTDNFLDSVRESAEITILNSV
ncbi:MAG: hypothetical protein QOC96_95 [Acidobacteriota bacterium]|jgi:hypothetical protein|nr:hypothetical protein [Acidobacteriota bacterium]